MGEGGEGRAETSRPVCAAAAAAEAEEGLLSSSSSESATARADGDAWVATPAVSTSRSRSRSRSRLGIGISTDGFASPIAIRRRSPPSRGSQLERPAPAASCLLWFLVGDFGCLWFWAIAGLVFLLAGRRQPEPEQAQRRHMESAIDCLWRQNFGYVCLEFILHPLLLVQIMVCKLFWHFNKYKIVYHISRYTVLSIYSL